MAAMRYHAKESVEALDVTGLTFIDGTGGRLDMTIGELLQSQGAELVYAIPAALP